MRKIFLSPFIFSIFLYACQPSTEQGKTTTDSTANKTEVPAVSEVQAENGDTLSFPERNGIKLVAMDSIPDFPDAKLEQVSPKENAKVNSPVNFKYTLTNYQLGDQTSKDGCTNCANSDKGQHIHLILNNNPYIAVYDTEHKEKLGPGHYVELSFLSRSYHISVKNPDAYVLREFTVGNPEAKSVEFDKNAPQMFYSRPKGSYTTEEGNVILDFFLVNTKLSPDGNKVRATINGNSFIITHWRPYVIEGLQEGETTVKLELLDNTGALVKSPFNPVERKITITKEGAA